MEADKRISKSDNEDSWIGLLNKVDWSWAVSTINQAVNQHLMAIENDDGLDPETKKLKVNDIKKAWQRILIG